MTSITAAPQAQKHRPYLEASREAALRAMGPNTDRMTELWGPEFDPLVRLIAWATAPYDGRMAEIQASLTTDPRKPTLIIMTERDDDSRQYSAAAAIIQQCNAHHTPFHVLISGGNYLEGPLAEYGEESAAAMLGRLLSVAPPGTDRLCSVDQMARHTGHQGLLIGGTIRAMHYRRVIAVVPTVHIVRFMLTYTFDLIQFDLAHQIEQLAVGIGEWERPLRRRLTVAEEAFGPILAEDDPRLISPHKRIGGEYAERLRPECDGAPGKWCPAALPSQMCSLLGLSS